MLESVPPERLRSPRMLIRCWHPDDAPAFKRSLDASLEAMRPWIPWTRAEPSELSVLTARLAGYREDFFAGRDALYGLLDLDDREVLGGIGLYRRVGPGAIELGYWIRSDLAGRGLTTEASRVLTEVAFSLPDIDRIEVHCDPDNGASVAIPRKLGYRHRETVHIEDERATNESGATMIWEMTAARYHEQVI